MAGTTKPRVEKIEFLNRTQGYLGVIKINRKGDDAPEAVRPGERVFLTAEEVTLTAQAHVRPEDSPFELREIVHYERETGDEIARFTAAPLEKQEKRVKAAA